MSKPPKHKGSLMDQAKDAREGSYDMLYTADTYATFDPQSASMARDMADMLGSKAERMEQEKESIAKEGIAAPSRTRGKVFGKARHSTQRAGKKNGSIVTSMLGIRNQIKVYHWQTKSFARHKATDEFVTELDGLIDSFVETYMGKYGRPKVTGSIPLHNFSESAAKSFVAKQTVYLSKGLPRSLKSTDTDLLNIRDEILGLVNKTMYLFSLA